MAARRHLEHLPPDAVAGPQSERRRLNLRVGGTLSLFLILAGIVFLLMVAGSALLLGALAPDVGGETPGPDPAWLWLAGAGGAACFFVAAFILWRKAHPRHDKALEIRLDRRRARRGDELRATVTGASDRAAVEVTLACRVHWDMRGPSSRSANRLARTVAENLVWHESTQSSPSGEVILRLPADQPYSHEGQVVSFAWLIDAQTVVHGQRGRPSAPGAVWVDP
jgi:membrane protein implicated in regulation of membrane protease activity